MKVDTCNFAERHSTEFAHALLTETGIRRTHATVFHTLGVLQVTYPCFSKPGYWRVQNLKMMFTCTRSKNTILMSECTK